MIRTGPILRNQACTGRRTPGFTIISVKNLLNYHLKKPGACIQCAPGLIIKFVAKNSIELKIIT